MYLLNYLGLEFCQDRIPISIDKFQNHSKLIEMDHGDGDYCGANVDKIDMFKYPSLQNLPWWSARLESGDCLYLPYGLVFDTTAFLLA